MLSMLHAVIGVIVIVANLSSAAVFWRAHRSQTEPQPIGWRVIWLARLSLLAQIGLGLVLTIAGYVSLNNHYAIGLMAAGSLWVGGQRASASKQPYLILAFTSAVAGVCALAAYWLGTMAGYSA